MLGRRRIAGHRLGRRDGRRVRSGRGRAADGRTADGPPGGDGVESRASTAHSTRLSGRPSATTAALPGPGQAVSPSVVAPAGSRVVTFVNRVSQTIWVAASPDAAHPLAATGWVLPAGQSVSIVVPDHYNGRFWGRTGCVFSGGHRALPDRGLQRPVPVHRVRLDPGHAGRVQPQLL